MNEARQLRHVHVREVALADPVLKDVFEEDVQPADVVCEFGEGSGG